MDMLDILTLNKMSFFVPDSAAEEAGLQVGDILIAVNGTDVTSMPHSEAANLARKGKIEITINYMDRLGLLYNAPNTSTQVG